jgi:transcriptional regulator with XRE-family HTH domain
VDPSNFRSIDESFGKLFLEARKAKGISQEAVAAALASRGYVLHVTTIGKIERGERRVSVGEAVALASALGLTLDVLVAGSAAIDSRYEALRTAEHNLDVALDAYTKALLEVARTSDETGQRALMLERTPAQRTSATDWLIERELGEGGLAEAGENVRLLYAAVKRDEAALEAARDEAIRGG